MTQPRPSIADKRRTFRHLHESGCFVIPNPWDVGSARYLQGLGFKALATTSSGFAWSQARPDGGVKRDRVLAHLQELVAATDIPLNADFENGFAADSVGVGESVRLAVETGIAGVSIEDSTGNASAPLFELNAAVERVRAARRAIDQSGGDTLLIARAECFLVGLPDLHLTIARLKAYANCGADCLYAPGIRTIEQIRALVDAVHPKPVNLLVSGPGDLTLRHIADLGVRRVSVGGSLARVAWGGFMRAALEIAELGIFDGLANAAAGKQLDAMFKDA
jgi:2-methylisocitrate lyase-like PEP mutase family enzyme